MKRPTRIYIIGWTKQNREAAQEKMATGNFEAIFICTKAGKIMQTLTVSQFGNGLIEIINY
jgi:hypothetical protein